MQRKEQQASLLSNRWPWDEADSSFSVNEEHVKTKVNKMSQLQRLQDLSVWIIGLEMLI